MKEREHTREALLGASLLGLTAICFGAFSKKQREWFIKRDGGKCQFPVDDNKGGIRPCGVTQDLQVHHISPQRYSESQGLDQDLEVDVAENGITLGKYHHTKVIHPDMQDCLADYGRQKKLGVKKPDSFNRMFKKRQEQLDRGEKYWDDSYDDALREIAQENTYNFNEPYPQKKRRTTVNRKGRKWYEKLFD